VVETIRALEGTQHVPPPGDVLADLMARHHDGLLRFLIGRLRDYEGAQDCAQDTFIRAYEALLKGKVINSQWLYQVARNRATDEFRQRKRRDFCGLPLDEVPTSDSGEAVHVSSVRAAATCLTPHDLDLLYLAHVDGLSSKAIGHGLGVQAGAARMRLCRAHKRFRSVYRDTC
jgi:RNA polymerase sigma factor (sigma-70 family)